MYNYFGNAWNWILQEIVPILYAYRVEKILLTKHENIHVSSYSIEELTDYSELSQFIQGQLSLEDERRKTIDEKAKSSLVSITVVIAVMLALLKDGASVGLPFGILIMLAILCFLFAVIGAVKAIENLPYAQVTVEDLIKENGSSLEHKKICEKDMLLEFYKYYKANSVLNNNKGNFVDSSFKSIRNGVILLCAAIVLTMLLP